MALAHMWCNTGPISRYALIGTEQGDIRHVSYSLCRRVRVLLRVHGDVQLSVYRTVSGAVRVGRHGEVQQCEEWIEERISLLAETVGCVPSFGCAT